MARFPTQMTAIILSGIYKGDVMARKGESSRERCELHKAGGLKEWCTRNSCIFWRLIEQQDEDISNVEGCGLQHFQVIEQLKPEMVDWMLSIKKQLEDTSPEIEKSRITFKHREK
jgi:hypothetical protein